MRQEPQLDPAGLPASYAAARPAPVPRRRGSGRWLFLLIVLLLLAPVLAVVALRWLPPPTSAFMLQSTVQPVRYQWVPASRIAEAARRAVVAAEDQRFRQHHGFDVEAIEEAYAHNQHARHRRGASTISQQTAKNLFLWPGGGYFRKGVEAGFTVLIETLWTKDRILEVYLNIAEFGPGIYGVEAAAQTYFGKSAAQLDAGEAARLAAILPNPRHWSVRSPGPYVQSRVDWILGQMGARPHAPIEEEPPPPPASEGGTEPDNEEAAPSTLESEEPAPAEPLPVTPDSPPPQAN
jgi:monofunctional biosynthetic peptidoglycan transglycosylase